MVPLDLIKIALAIDQYNQKQLAPVSGKIHHPLLSQTPAQAPENCLAMLRPGLRVAAATNRSFRNRRCLCLCYKKLPNEQTHYGKTQA